MSKRGWARAALAAAVMAGCNGEAQTPGTTGGDGEASLTGVFVTGPATTLQPNESAQLRAFATFSDGTSRDISEEATWTTSDADAVSVSATGAVTAGASGSAIITAEDAESGKNGSTSLTVIDVHLVALSVSPATLDVPAGRAASLTATGIFSDGSTADLTSSVTWTSDSEAVATVIGGTATGVMPGTTTIRAAFDGRTGSASATVTNALLSGISILSPEQAFAVGTSVTMHATGIFTDATTLDLTSSVVWSSSAPTVVAVSGGVAVAGNAGSATLEARDLTSGVTGTFAVTITSAALTSIVVTPPDPSIPAGTTVALSATGVFSDGSTQDLTGQVDWTSADEAVARTDKGTVSGVAAGGPVTVTASRGAITGSVDLTITSANLVALTVDPASASSAVGTKVQFTATGVFSDGSRVDLTNDPSVTWSSSDPSIFTVDGDGLVTTVLPGNANVEAQHTSGMQTVVPLVVTSAQLVAVHVTPMTVQLGVGMTRKLTATGLYDDGSTADLTSVVTWSATGAAATVGATTGVVRGVQAGTADLRADMPSGGLFGTTTVNVGLTPLVSIFVTPTARTLETFTKQPLTATGVYADGSTADLTDSVTWTSESAALSVNPITGVVQGTDVCNPCMARATVPGTSISNAATFTFVAPTIVGLSVSPDGDTLYVGDTLQLTATALYSNQRTADATSLCLWTSDASSYLSVSPLGLASALLGGTTATVTATRAGTLFSDSVEVVVSSASVVGLFVSPGDGTVIPLGADHNFRVYSVTSDGILEEVTDDVTWTSSDPLAVDIDGFGMASALMDTGAAVTLTATHAGLSMDAEVDVVVGAPVIRAVSFAERSPSLFDDATLPLRAIATLSDGTTQDVTADTTWSGNDPSILTVDATGLVTPVAPGTSTVTLTHVPTGRVASASVTVFTHSSPTFTAAPSFDVDPVVAGDVVNVTLYVSSDTRQVSMNLYADNGQTFGSLSASWSTPESQMTIPVRVSCFAGAPLHVRGYLYSASGSNYAYYDLDSQSSTHYRLQQYGPGMYVIGASDVGVSRVSVSPGSCSFPSMSASPLLGAVTGGQNVDVTVQGTVGAVTAYSYLYETTSGQNLGQGTVPASPGDVVVATRTSCLGTGTQVYPRVSVYDASGWSTTYYREPSISTSFYSVQHYDGIAYDTPTATALPLTLNSFTPAGSPTCVSRLVTASVTPSTISLGSPTQVSVQFSGLSSSASVSLYTTVGNYGGGSSSSTQAPGTVPINVTPFATGTFYPRLTLSFTNGSASYYYSPANSATNYYEQLYDGFVSVFSVTSVTIPSLTVN